MERFSKPKQPTPEKRMRRAAAKMVSGVALEGLSTVGTIFYAIRSIQNPAVDAYLPVAIVDCIVAIFAAYFGYMGYRELEQSYKDHEQAKRRKTFLK